MTVLSRRRFVASASALCACPATAMAAAISQRKREKLDSMANSAIYYMIENIPATREMVEQAAGLLLIPVVSKGALFFGGAVGDGVLRVGGETTSYYSSVQFNAGIQFSASQYSQALFFLNENALNRFINSDGWTFGAGMRYVVMTETDGLRMDTLSQHVDVAALTFGDTGLHMGVSLDGTKYTRFDD